MSPSGPTSACSYSQQPPWTAWKPHHLSATHVYSFSFCCCSDASCFCCFEEFLFCSPSFLVARMCGHPMDSTLLTPHKTSLHGCTTADKLSSLPVAHATLVPDRPFKDSLRDWLPSLCCNKLTCNIYCTAWPLPPAGCPHFQTHHPTLTLKPRSAYLMT